MLPQLKGGGKTRTITQRIIGQTDGGQDVIEYRMCAGSGLQAVWLNYGATLTQLVLPDGTNVVVGFDDPMRYLSDHPNIGVTIGPVANRIGQAQFTIDGQTFQTESNAAPNTLHSGSTGWQHRVWDVAIVDGLLEFSLDAPDGEGGFPGARSVVMMVQLAENALRMEWFASTDAPSPINITQHSYFNMSGDVSQVIDDHALQSGATHYTQTDADHIPTGQTLPVTDTPLDFTEPAEIGPRIIDNNLLVPGAGLRDMAALTDGVRTLFLQSDAPGFQLFTGEALESVGFIPRAGLALEPQSPPDAVNHPVDGIDTVLHPDEDWHMTIQYILHGPGLPG